MDETVICFQFTDHKTHPKRKIKLPYFNKFLIDIIVFFWNMLKLPDLRELERLAKDNGTSTILLLLSLIEATRYFDDKALKDTALDALRRYIKKAEFGFGDLVTALHSTFEGVNQPPHLFDASQKLLFTAATMRTEETLPLVLHGDDGQDEERNMWKHLMQTQAFIENWYVAMCWHIKRSASS